MSDLVTFGETMLRLSPPGAKRLETTSTFEVRVGGAESNVAIAAERLGAVSTWLSTVPETPLGRRVVDELHRYGIDTNVVWATEGRQPTYYVEHAGVPRGTSVHYDREDSPIRSITPDEIPVKDIESARAFFISGITPALSSTVEQTTRSLLQTAKNADTTTVFDVNYRRALWSPATAKQTLERLFPAIDVLVIAARDARTVLDVDGDPRQLAHSVASQYDFETVVVTRGSKGATAWHDTVVYDQSAVETDTVDPIGSGDAFTGAFIARRLSGDEVPRALEYATATAALTRTIPGDVADVRKAEVDAIVAETADSISR